jgi:hypothetical protein
MEEQIEMDNNLGVEIPKARLWYLSPFVWLPGGILMSMSLLWFVLNIASAYIAVSEFAKRFDASQSADVSSSNLSREVAFLQARFDLSRIDTTVLVMDFENQIISLEMGGVLLHQSSMEVIGISSLLKNLKPETLAKIAAKPSRVVQWWSNIEKEPLKVQHAPESPEEAEKLAAEIPEVKTHEAFFSLDLDTGVRLVFMHHDETGFGKFLRIAGQNIKVALQQAGQLLRGKLPAYIPIIRLEVSPDDALIIFRAIPENANVVINPVWNN